MKNPFAVRLDPPEMERSYRLAALGRDAPQIIVIFVIAAVMALMFLLLDLTYIEDARHKLAAGIGRGFTVLCLFLGAWILRMRPSVRMAEGTVLAVMFVLVAHIILVNALQHYSMVGALIWDVIVVFTIYTLLPVSLSAQVFGAVLLTVGEFAVWSQISDVSLGPTDTSAILAAVAATHGIGIFASLQLARSRRRQFAVRVQEFRERVDLEKALSEIRVLRGIIPICAHCRKVRNDGGFWEQVEVYVATHTDADFSHSVCPACLREFYPEFVDEVDNRMSDG